MLLEAAIAEPDAIPILEQVSEAIAIVASLPFEVDAWDAQNALHLIARDRLAEYRTRAEESDEHASHWIATIEALAKQLALSMSALSY